MSDVKAAAEPLTPLELMLDLLHVEDDEELCFATSEDRTFRRLSVAVSALRAMEQPRDRNVYLGFVVLDGAGTAAANARRVLGFWADLDVKPGGMPDWASAEAVVTDLSLKLGAEPTFVIWSGHGLQPVWRLARTDSHDIDRIREVLPRFGDLVKEVAAAHGGAADSVFDLARVLRMPGTVNHKDPRQPVEATLQVRGGREISLADVERAVVARSVSAHSRTTGSTQPVGAADESPWADKTCDYVARMVAGWRTDQPVAGRHSWAYSQQIRLAAARRLGCVAEADYEAALVSLQLRLDELRAHDGLRPGEVRDNTRYAVEVVRAKTEDDCRAELGHHEHHPPPAADGFGHTDLSDGAMRSAALGRRMARDWDGRFIFVPGLGWHRWDGRRWDAVDDSLVVAEAATWAEEFIVTLLRDGAPRESINAALRYREVGNVAQLVAGAKTATALLVQVTELDGQPHLLNCANGVVDLTTGLLAPSDPQLLMTKVTSVPYQPGFTHPDWTLALQSLDPSPRVFLQQRLGQALFGYPPPSDEVLLCDGGGQNGKTSVLGTVRAAVGDYGVVVSERVLLGSPDQHPTEFMDFRGARFAYMEETPEARRLEPTRLKRIVGTPTIKARRVHKDPVEFPVTHSLFISTNYRPVVDEVDHGTWRRLKRLPFPFTFRDSPDDVVAPTDRLGSPGLRQRLGQPGSGGQRAALAWLVDGAVAHHRAGYRFPPAPAEVSAATAEWRKEADLVLAFFEDRLTTDSKACVLASELLEEFNHWLGENHHRPWSAQTFATRFGGHSLAAAGGIIKIEVRNPVGLSGRYGFPGAVPPKRATVWSGIRFRDAEDEPPEDASGRHSPADGDDGDDEPETSHGSPRVGVSEGSSPSSPGRGSHDGRPS